MGTASSAGCVLTQICRNCRCLDSEADPGRRDKQVKIRGYRVELSEIEAGLDDHLAVQQAAVVACGDNGDRTLVAYVEPHPGSQPTLSDLREHLHQRLPAFMVPSAFVLLEQLPTTASGKVDRGALPGLEQKGVAQPQAPTRPTSDLQCQLIAIWEKVLDVRPIGDHRRFL